MSFVGPRALGLDEDRILEELIPGFRQRLQVRPGLTGLAQVYDKTDDPYEKYHYDMTYIEKRSLILDTSLLLHSLWNTLFGRWDRRSGKNMAHLANSERKETATQQKASPKPRASDPDDYPS